MSGLDELPVSVRADGQAVLPAEIIRLSDDDEILVPGGRKAADGRPVMGELPLRYSVQQSLQEGWTERV